MKLKKNFICSCQKKLISGLSLNLDNPFKNGENIMPRNNFSFSSKDIDSINKNSSNNTPSKGNEKENSIKK